LPVRDGTTVTFSRPEVQHRLAERIPLNALSGGASAAV
jgi:hypothetical protein